MELVQGRTLSAWLAEERRSWRQIRDLFLAAGAGLQAAHETGLVHRDFKPQNVMVGRDGAVRVADFGLARRIDSVVAMGEDGGAEVTGDDRVEALTQTGVRVGTPYYMAPEQVAGRAADARSDQFSFCVALYWALSGTHPFGGSTPTELAKNRAAGTMLPSPGVPPWLMRIVRRGLSFEPDERWPSMDDLLAVLGRDRSRQRRRALYVVAALLLVGATGIATARSVASAPRFCTGGAGRLDGIWEAPGAGAGSRRETVKSAIMKSGVPEPTKTWERVAVLLDQYSVKWVGTYRDTCEATRVRGEQSEEILDLRMACLDDHLDSMRALTELLSVGDRAIVERAVEATSVPDGLASCGATEALRFGPRLPKDPLLRKSVEEARKRLKEGEALRRVGKYEKATAIADEVLAREAGRTCPVEPDALFLKAASISSQGASVNGFESAKAAVLSAERCGHDRVLVMALDALIFDYPTDRTSELDLLVALHDAALKRIGGDPLLEAWFANDLGGLRARQGRLEEARLQMMRAIELKETTSGPQTIDLAISYSNLADILSRLRRFDEACSYAERAISIERSWSSGDSDAIDLGMALQNWGDALLGMRRLTEAEDAYDQSLAVLKLRAPMSEARFQALAGLARISLLKGNVNGAISTLENLLRDQERSGVHPEEVARTQLKLADAYARSHRHGPRVRDLASEALATFDRIHGWDSERRDAQALLSRASRGR